jgi:LCP family protein required for cell wall assembly
MTDDSGNQNRPEAPRPRARHRQRRRLSRYGLPLPRARTVAVVVLGFLLSGVGGAVSFFWPTITAAWGITGHSIQNVTPPPSRAPSPGDGPAGSPTPTPAAPSGTAFTVLLLGSDNDGKFVAAGSTSGFCCTQSMILMRVDPSAGTVVMLSFPRDMYVHLVTPAGGGMGKISEAFGDANAEVRNNQGGVVGIQAEVQTVESDFNVSIDHYVWIGLQGLINLINDVGGIDIVASHPVMDDYYPYDVAGSNNPFATDRVSVLPGAQHMNGYTALEYVRSRHDDLSEDLGRTVRQQQVLTALRARLAGMSLADVNSIASALNGQVLTDVSLTDIPTLLGLAKGIGSGNITHVFIPSADTPGATINGADVLVPDMGAITSLVHQYFPAA